MTPDEHAAMIATRQRFVAAGQAWRIPKVGTQTSADGTGDVPSCADAPKGAPVRAQSCADGNHERCTVSPTCGCRCHAAKPAALTLWDQTADLWSTDR